MTQSEASQRRTPALTLPEYEPLQFPLNAKAAMDVEALARKPCGGQLEGLEALLHQAMNTLNECVQEINELAARRSADAPKNDDDDAAAEYKSNVASMTKRMDEHMRSAIDDAQDIKDIKAALAKISAEARLSRDSTTQTQRAVRRAHDEDETQELDMDGTATSIVTRPGATGSISGPSSRFETMARESKDNYGVLPPRRKYADHNNYNDFKAAWWDGLHAHLGQELVPDLPSKSTWFKNDDDNDDEMEEDDDDDVQAVSSKMKTTCPLTLGEMENPTRNRKCPHVFEKTAIESYIRGNSRGSHGPACPASGCDKRLQLGDLFVDLILSRKIKRIQQANARNTRMDVDDEGDGDNEDTAIDIDNEDSEDPDEMDITQPEPRASVRVKGEPRSSRY